MPLLSPEKLRATLTEPIPNADLTRFDFASLRATLLAMAPDARAALLLDRMRAFADGHDGAYGFQLPAASFVIDVTDDKAVITLAFALLHKRLTKLRHRVRGDALRHGDSPYYAVLLRAAGPAGAPYVATLLRWHSDDDSIVGVVLDALRDFADPVAVGAVTWVARFDKANRTRAVAMLAALGEEALGVIESLAGSDEPAAREVAFRALAELPSCEAAHCVAARVRARVKGVPRAVKEAIVAMAAKAPPGAMTPVELEDVEVLPKREKPVLPPLPDTARVAVDLRALEVEADAVPRVRRDALVAALEGDDVRALDAAVDAIGAPALSLAVRWRDTQQTGDPRRVADGIARVSARVPVTSATAAAVVPALVLSTYFGDRDVTPILERFADHLLAPATVAFAPGGWIFNRYTAIAVLARHDPRASQRLLLDALGDTRSWQSASEGLETLGAEGWEGLAALLHGKDFLAALGAARHLERVADPGTLVLIEYALPRVNEGLHDALTKALQRSQAAGSGGPIKSTA